MCTNANTTTTNPDNFNEEKAVLEQAHIWIRNVNNSTWLITSFFIGLNLVALTTVLSNLRKPQIKGFLEYLTYGEREFLALLIFATLWLIPAFCALTMMRVGEKLYFFLRRTSGFNSIHDSFTLENLCRALKWCEPIVSPESEAPSSWFNKLRLKMSGILEESKRTLFTIRFPLGLVIAGLTIFFGATWCFILKYLN